MLTFKKITALIVVISMLSSCVVPTFSDKGTPEKCEILTKKVGMEFIGRGLEGLNADNCRSDVCGVVLTVIAGVFVTSAIISSSIYLVGNTAYYLEKKVRCDDQSIIDDQVDEFSQKMEVIGAKKVAEDKVKIEVLTTEESIHKEPEIKVWKIEELEPAELPD